MLHIFIYPGFLFRPGIFDNLFFSWNRSRLRKARKMEAQSGPCQDIQVKTLILPMPTFKAMNRPTIETQFAFNKLSIISVLTLSTMSEIRTTIALCSIHRVSIWRQRVSDTNQTRVYTVETLTPTQREISISSAETWAKPWR